MAPRKDFAAMEARRSSGDNAARAALRSRMAHPTSLRLDELQANPLNPRYREEDPEVQELASTLGRVGQLQPALIVSREQYLTAYPDQTESLGPQPWVVLVGNRRLAASKLADRATLDVRVADDLDTPEDFEDRVLIENVQRKDLPPLLEAEHLQRRLARPGQTMRSVGEAIGKSHAYVAQRLDLLKLIPEFQDLLRRGELNLKTGRRLGAMPADEQQLRLAAGAPYLSPSTVPAVTNGRAAEAEESVNPVYKETSDPKSSLPRRIEPPQPAEDDAPPPTVSPADATAMGTDAGSAPREASPATQTQPGHRRGTSGRDVEEIRLSVVERLDSALAELDAILPAGPSTPLESSLAESHRHILAARRVLAGHPTGS